jgi:hypothetical protein
MAIPSRQIGWGTEENLLWQIAKQIQYLTQVTGTFGGGGGGGVTTLLAGTGVSVDQATGNVTVTNTAIGGFHMPVKQVLSPGTKYSAAINGTAPSSTSYIANALVLSPFIPANDITISNVSIQVNTGVASSLAKILVYADVNGAPQGLLIESPDLDCSTNGTKTYNTVYTFEASKTYWLGAIVSSTQSIRSLTAPNLITIGVNGSATSIYTVRVSTAYLYTDPVPTDPSTAFLNSGNVPMVMLQ